MTVVRTEVGSGGVAMGLGGPMGERPGFRWPGFTSGDVRVLGRCVARVLADSNRTQDIIIAEEIAAQRQLRHLIERGTFASSEGGELWAERPELSDVVVDELRAMPQGTLGRSFADFLDEHGLSYELVDQPTPYTRDDDVAYVLRRLRHSHDIWHTLLGIGTKGHEEVLVHAFSIAQTGLLSSAAIIGLGAIKHMVLEGRGRYVTHGLRAAYQRGLDAVPLLGVYWERHWLEPLDEVRQACRVRVWQPV